MLGGCKHNYLEVFVCVPETIKHARPEVDTGRDRFRGTSEVNVYRDMAGLRVQVLNAVDQSFIEIKDDRLLVS